MVTSGGSGPYAPIQGDDAQVLQSPTQPSTSGAHSAHQSAHHRRHESTSTNTAAAAATAMHSMAQGRQSIGDRYLDDHQDDDEAYELIPRSRSRTPRGSRSSAAAATGKTADSPTSPTRSSHDRHSQDHDDDDKVLADEMDHDELPLFKDEDLDLDSAMSMVRRIVPESDDPTLPALTFRVFILGTILCILGGQCSSALLLGPNRRPSADPPINLTAAVSQLFFFKSNAPSFSSFFVILIAFPLGHWMTSILPESLSSGEFNKKEHLLIGVLAGSGASAAYAGEIISVQDLYYKTDLGAIGGLLLLLSTQLIGFAFSGLTYRLLVRPTAMLWPSTLVYVTLFETLHGGAKESIKETKDRMKFFTYNFLGIFSWQFLPALVFPTLTSIAVLCIMNNQSLIMRTLGSGYDGFGFLCFSLDWSVIGGTGALYTPFFAQASYFFGLAFVSQCASYRSTSFSISEQHFCALQNMWVITPLLYFGNFWNARSFDSPLAAHLYNSTFGRLDVLEILNPDLSLNETRYAEVQPILLTPYFALCYGVSFAVLTSAITTVLLWHMNDIKAAFTTRKDAVADIHVEMLERSYDPIPNRYYFSVFFSMILAAIALVTFYPMQLPIWGLLLSILMAVAFLVPVGYVDFGTLSDRALAAETDPTPHLTAEFVAGYLFPGRPIANIVFKVYELTLVHSFHRYMTMVQSIDLTADMKLGLYCKIPPRHLFICQVYGTALGSVVNYSLIRGVINSKRPYLDGTLVDPTGQWSGRKPEIFMVRSRYREPLHWLPSFDLLCDGTIEQSASVIWGLIAPRRFFAGQYSPLYWGFLVGALLPIIPWILYKRTNNRFWKRISIPLILHGSIAPPQMPTNVILPGKLTDLTGGERDGRVADGVYSVRKRAGFLVSFASQFYALRYRPRWFEKYVYVLSSALDAGTSINALMIYVFGWSTFFEWWGNSRVDTEHCIPGS
ncbi:BZ3500_MvSof-1268-A1-R1_Chr2-3g05297 [Microbotryum saponariae]|uniref:BZ3500_MvSof-1268-A1-R1_Chr2-3g05297 protein n=1 Tax=Microbotryum saponariae TaxID=289078 RepID=A0A2X0N296_9BASI|nr:BZ3500_MvSof-1268-A1-R1_Chr2-3g05297 [Microbotryum saponariae]SDA01142.1 BZ3501_MvSof-1269-A2-R1_Chr2-2g04970 [Microbotryum saponariae]